MFGKYIHIVILITSVIQGISAKHKEKPLVPRLKYTSKGRHLDNSESITHFLAKHNTEGFPNELFYRSLEDDSTQDDQHSMELMMEALSSQEAQRSLEEAALDYFADVLDEPEAHAAVKYSGRDQSALCSYSWLSWVPWLDCPSEQRGNPIDELPTNQLHAQCVDPKVVRSYR